MGGFCHQKAGDGIRTHDTLLGKQVLYQLSYTRTDYNLTEIIGLMQGDVKL